MKLFSGFERGDDNNDNQYPSAMRPLQLHMKQFVVRSTAVFMSSSWQKMRAYAWFQLHLQRNAACRARSSCHE